MEAFKPWRVVVIVGKQLWRYLRQLDFCLAIIARFNAFESYVEVRLRIKLKLAASSGVE